MMTREKAIEVLENGGWWDSLIPVTTIEGRIEEDKLHEALDLAIAALRPVSRERVEKAWRGEWLNFYNDFSTAECSKCGELFEVSPDETPKEEFFKAFKEFYHSCPSCGASMTDEAVEMVMERLEELSNGKG